MIRHLGIFASQPLWPPQFFDLSAFACKSAAAMLLKQRNIAAVSSNRSLRCQLRPRWRGTAPRGGRVVSIILPRAILAAADRFGPAPERGHKA